jgi:transposase-like protein
MYKWLREADLQKQPQFSKDVAALKQEVNGLNAAFKCATEERDILKIAAVHLKCIVVAIPLGKQSLYQHLP